MIDKHRLVVVTPAGRRRYLEILARYVLGAPEVDRFDLWANTADAGDLAWMDALAAREPRVKVVRGDWPLEGNFSIHRYFAQAADPDTVYVRLDDDIVWAGPDAIATLARERVADPGPFLLYANVLNSGITSHLQQRAGRLTLAHGKCGYDCVDPVGWGSGKFAADLHRAFLKTAEEEVAAGEAMPWAGDPYLRPLTTLRAAINLADRWRLPDWNLWDYERHSINAISWLGSDAARWVGEIDRDEELWLSVLRPKQEQRPNRIVGRAVVAHFAYYAQRDTGLSGAVEDEILAGYRKLAGI